MGHNNIIELNGKRYDAITGAYLGKGHSKPVPAAPSQSLSIDGVKRPSAKPTTHHKQAEPSKHQHVKPDGKHVHHKTHHATPSKPGNSRHNNSAHHTKPHKPERAKTLMRGAVKKPASQIASEIAAKPTNNLEFKKAAHAVNKARLQRSLQTPKHNNVQRFGNVALTAPAPAAITQTRPVADIRPTQPTELKPARHAMATPTVSQVFENAVARATSHEQPAPKLKPSRRKRVLQATLAAILLLALTSGVLWSQKSNIELKLASFQAGFQADRPSYQLTGYEHQSTRQNHGQVILLYRSGNRYYEVTQQRSDWNSQTLLDSSVLGIATDKPKTIESRGRIVYLYKNNEVWNASWVDGGVRFDITGNAHLTKDDIRSIVDSM